MGTIKTNLAKVYILYIHTHTHIYINIIMFSTTILTCLSIISLSQSKVSRNSTIIITWASSEPLNKKHAQETVQLSSSALSSSSIIGLSSSSSNNNDKEGEIDVIKKEIIKVENSNNHEQKEANVNNSAHINNYIRSISSITRNKERKLDEEDGDNDNNNLDLNDVVDKANDIYEKTSNIYNKTSETVGDVKETLDTAPTSWTKSQWTIIGILIAVGLVAFGCIYRCIPCTPRII